MADEKEKQDCVEPDSSIVADIQWVYDNWGRLFMKNRQGERVFNEEVLAEAPSNAMASYALMNEKGFFDRFVIKLLPRDAGKAQEDEKLDEDRMTELDPSFEEMENFFDMEVEQERAEPTTPAEDDDGLIDF
jgi:hypothetical protein